MQAARLFALLAFLNSTTALIWRFFVAAAEFPPLQTVWGLYGYFTMFANSAVAAVGLAMALAPRGRMAAAPMRHASLVSILAVALIYSVALRGLADLSGAAALTNHMFHDVAPLLFLLAWLSFDHGTLLPRNILTALIFPICYLIYAMIRGAITDWYPYWFLDPTEIGGWYFALVVVILFAIFGAISAAVKGADHLLARVRGA